jgi:predicted PurR-regulated permease PerM
LANEPVQRWSKSTKRVVVLILLVLLALVLNRFRAVIPPLAVSILLAFILDPIVDFLAHRLPISRGFATMLVILVLIVAMLAVVAAPVTVVPSIARAVRRLQIDVIQIIADIGAFVEQPLEVGGYVLDLGEFYQELSSMLRSFVASVAQGTLDIVFEIASGAFWLTFILMAVFYLLRDADRLTEQIDLLAPPGYRDDFVRLRVQITDVWNAFLRGQLVMSLLMIAITTAAATAIGLPYPLVLGLIAGVMEFVPSLGPILALIPAVLLALFRGSTFLPLSNFWFAVVTVGVYILIQQVEGNLLLPRVMGNRLKLHPLVVLIGIIVGGSLAGILGMLIAAPTLATLRLVGRYVFARLYDRDPFPALEKETEPPPDEPGVIRRAAEAALVRLQDTVGQLQAEEEEILEEAQIPAPAEISKEVDSL